MKFQSNGKCFKAKAKKKKNYKGVMELLLIFQEALSKSLLYLFLHSILKNSLWDRYNYLYFRAGQTEDYRDSVVSPGLMTVYKLLSIKPK